MAEPSGKTEKAALEVALRQWAARQDPPDRAALADFFAAHPASPWKPALLGNLGLRALEEGRFTQATFRPEPNTPVSKLQGKREYYARDHWGSVRDVLDQQGNVQTR
ncbi:MAG: hypothetical protein LBF50_10165 [Azoarcus sp.]|nr:hypothetical protein [Azoarcus sp.]